MKAMHWLTSAAVCVLAAAPAAPAAEKDKPAEDVPAIEPTEKIALFDGKTFEGWKRVLRNPDADVSETWTIADDGVLGCTGKPAGYIRTEKAYRNYHLRFEYRWAGRTGNNGVLVHMVGEDKVWPKSLECQGMYKNQGDFFQIGGVEFHEHRAGGHRVRGRRVVKYGEHNEKKPGEWNVYEVWAVGDTVRPYVNGKLMNEATGLSLTAGRICLQSEGAPIEFRNITLAPAGPQEKPWPVRPKKKIELFNGKDFAGWVRVLHGQGGKKGTKGAKGKGPSVDEVWSVRDGVIHCTGKPNGYIRTTEHYADYKLHVEWRWVAKPTNSGVLLHKTGMEKVWPTCIEAQLMHRNAGDFWLLSHSKLTAGGKEVGGKMYHNIKKKHPTNEKPPGEWNSYDIVCDGGTITLTVNGLLQNQGTDAKPSSGPICLQSEGSPIEFRNITLEPLKK